MAQYHSQVQDSSQDKCLNFLSGPCNFIRNNATTLGMAALMAGMLQLGTFIDGKINPELIGMLRSNGHWWNFFTTRHYMTALTQEHPGLMTAIWAGIGAFFGHAFSSERLLRKMTR